MVAKIAELYGPGVDAVVKALTSTIEPLMIVDGIVVRYQPVLRTFEPI